MQSKYPPIKNTKIHIVTDCQSALQASVKCNITGNFGTILSNIERAVTNLLWTAGHIDLAGNEMADKSAKEAAMKARDSPITDASVSVSEIKNNFKKEGQKDGGTMEGMDVTLTLSFPRSKQGVQTFL